MVQCKKLILLCSLLAICVFSAPVDEDDEDEDDVELNDEQLNTNTLNSLIRTAPTEKWPMTDEKPYRVIVPYVIRESDYTTEALENFRAGLKDIEEKTCVRFVDRLKRHKDFIFVHDSGQGKCSSRIGKVGGKQPLRLTNKCMLVRKKCVHEMIHALGFHHMHQRYDRDDAIDIQWDNIAEKDRKWFRKFDNEWEAYNTPYDLWSCMNYAKNGFSKNGEMTIKTKNPEFQDEIGKQFTLSDGDAQRIVRMYRCPGQYWTSLSRKSVIVRNSAAD